MATKSSERAKIIGLRICEARDQAGLNNTTLAAETGIQRRTIVRLANGHNEPDIETLERIAVATKKPLSFFQVEQPRANLSAAVESLVDVLVGELRTKLTERAADLVEADL